MPTVTSASRQSSPSARRVHVIGAGPVGLFLTALLQTVNGLSLRLYEKRPDYKRARMVRLASHLAADSDGNKDPMDCENIDAVFEPFELEANLAFKQAVPADLMSLLSQWTRGFCPLNTIERSLSTLIQVRGGDTVERVSACLTLNDVLKMQEPGDIIIDCTGCNSLLRNHLTPEDGGPDDETANTVNIRLDTRSW